jgi:hypothetical protein
MHYGLINKQNRARTIFFLPALLLLSSMTAQASDVVARVVKATGEAWVVTGNQNKKKLADNDSVEENAVVSTGKDSTVSLLLNDHSLIKVGAGSRLEMAFTAKASEQVDVKLTEGVLKSIIKKRLDKKARWFRVHTPAATMGVRGTEFVTEVTAVPATDGGNGSQGLREQVLVTRGTVEVTDNSGKSLSLVQSGMGVEFTVSLGASGVRINQATLTPQPLSESQTETLKSDKFLTAPKSLVPLPSAAANGTLPGSGEANPVNGGAPPPAPIRGTNNSLAPTLGGVGAANNPAAGANAGPAGAGGAAPLAPPPRPPVVPPPPPPPASGTSGR